MAQHSDAEVTIGTTPIFADPDLLLLVLADTQVEAAAGATVIIGQGGEPLVLTRPAAGQEITIPAQDGALYVIGFDAATARVSVEGEDLILGFYDRGGRLVFSGFADTVAEGDGPSFQIGEETLSGDRLFDRASVPGAPTLSSIVDRLTKKAVFDQTVRGDFAASLPAMDDGDDEVLPVQEAIDTGGEADPASRLLITAIGVSVALDVPPLTGDGPVPAVMVAAMLYDFVQLTNSGRTEVETSDASLEFRNRLGDIVVLDLPDGIAVGAGGFLALYQDAAAGDGGDPTVIGRILDAAGKVVGAFEIPGTADWGLGNDTTEAVAVSLRTGGSEPLDSFAGNSIGVERTALTDPGRIAERPGVADGSNDAVADSPSDPPANHPLSDDLDPGQAESSVVGGPRSPAGDALAVLTATSSAILGMAVADNRAEAAGDRITAGDKGEKVARDELFAD